MANPPRQNSKENKESVNYYAEDSICNGCVLTWTEAVVEGSIPRAMMDGQRNARTGGRASSSNSTQLMSHQLHSRPKLGQVLL